MLLGLLQNRSTVRNWENTPVEKKHVDYITECITQTPYNQHQFNTIISIVTNREIIKEIFYKHTTCYFGNDDGKTDIGRPLLEDYNRKKLLFQGQLLAPLVILASMTPDDHDAENHGHMILFNAMISALECGLDTGFSACINKGGDINKLIGLSSDHETFLGLGIGYGKPKNKIDPDLSDFNNFFDSVEDEQGNLLGYNKKNMLPGMSRDSQLFSRNKIINIID